MRKYSSIFIFLLFLSGCVSSHYDRTENFQFLWKIGDLNKAGQEAERLSQGGPKRDRLLYYLEQGAVERMQRDRRGSISALKNAAMEYDRWFGRELITKQGRRGAIGF